MVGTRRPSAYGRQAAFDLSLAMARAGVGASSAAWPTGWTARHTAPRVQADAPHDCLSGHGHRQDLPRRPTPSCAPPLRRAAARSAASIRPATAGRTTGTFLARNRLIAAQSEALCVAEARTRSGTLNTVRPRRAAGPPRAGRAGQHLQRFERGHKRAAAHPPRRAALQSRGRAGYTGYWRGDRRAGAAAV